MATILPTCSIEGCDAPGVHTFGGAVDFTLGGEAIVIGTVAELNPEALIGLDAEAAAVIGAVEVVDFNGGTPVSLEYVECDDHFASF
ncbi:MAG: hypothetical protein VW799_09375 [Halieaceae bacterium]